MGRRAAQDVRRPGSRGRDPGGHEEPRAARDARGRRGRRHQLRDPRGRGRRVPRSQRRRQDDDAQDAVRAAVPDVGRGAGARPYAVEAGARLPAPDHDGDGQPEPAAVGPAGARLVRPAAGDLPPAAPGVRRHARRADRAARPRRPRQQAGPQPLPRGADEGRDLRRPAAPPGGAVPRRADDRPRRHRAEADPLVRRRVQPADRRDGAADEPLHGRRRRRCASG